MNTTLKSDVSVQPDLLFGAFTLCPSQRLLTRDGIPVPMGSRAMDLLLALTANPSRVMSRDELVALIWPRTVVEDSSLRFHVSTLRKSLGDGHNGARFIVNVPGRGYSFVAPTRLATKHVETSYQTNTQITLPVQVSHALCVLPKRLTPVIGRDEIFEQVALSLKLRRFVSIVGSGGIGKSAVAIKLGSVFFEEYGNSVYFLDLSTVSDLGEFIIAVARLCGLSEALLEESADKVALICQHLAPLNALLILDNCEHMLDSVAYLSESLLKKASYLKVLATSQEPLDAEGEWVYRLGPLNMPDPECCMSVAEALTFGAVRLFVDRACASASDFSLGERNLSEVLTLCRLLEGNPLALELAAGRVGSLGVGGLISRRQNLNNLLSSGRRNAPKRQASLQASCEWSFSLLQNIDRIVVRRLAVFFGNFDFDAATSVVIDLTLDQQSQMEPNLIAESVLRLCAKSILQADTTATSTEFRLFNSVRSYAHDKLVEVGELREVSQRHAQHILDVLSKFHQFNASAEKYEAFERRHRDDVNAAIFWAESATGNAELARSLSSAFDAVLARTPLREEQRFDRLHVGRGAIAPLVEADIEIPSE